MVSAYLMTHSLNFSAHFIEWMTHATGAQREQDWVFQLRNEQLNSTVELSMQTMHQTVV